VTFAIHHFVFRHPLAQPFEDMPHEWIAVLRPAVMRPLSAAPPIHQARAL
jgi:hypothetical protein